MKKNLLLFVGWLFCTSIFSQAIPNIDWVRNYSEKPAIANVPSAIDASNNVYVTGYTFTATNFDFTTLKYDQLGNLLWTAHYNNPLANLDDYATAIALDASGNVYVTGKSKGTTSNYDYATVKYNSAGVQQWAVRYNGPANGIDEAATLSVDNTGNVFVTGTSAGITSGTDYATIKYNSSGVQQWVSRYNGLGNGNDVSTSLVLGAGNRVFVSGTAKGLTTNNDIVTLRYNASTGATMWTRISNGTASLDEQSFAMVTNGTDAFICGRTQIAATNSDYFLSRINGNTGVNIWTSTYDGYGMNDIASSLIIDGSGNIVETGISRNISTSEYHTVKYNSSGVQQWVGKYNIGITTYAVTPKIAVDPFNYYYVCGETLNGTNTDFALLQYTTSGIHNWTETHNGAVNGNDAATDMVVDNFARIYVTGQTYNGSAKYDYTTIKYSQTPVYAPIDFNGEVASNTFQFYENKGQLINTDTLPIPGVKYYTNDAAPALYFQNTSLSYVFSKIDTIESTPDTLHRIDLKFVQSNPLTKIYAFEPQENFLNYYLAHCPNGITDVKGFQRLMIPNIYPNIDLHYYSNQNGLKYYFVVKPGGDPNMIKMLYDGTSSSSVNIGTGELAVNSSIGNILQDRPTPYQITFSGAIVPITAWQANYLNVSTNTYKFNIGLYNPALPLVIMVSGVSHSTAPIGSTANLCWSTYLGGGGTDNTRGVDVDASGNQFVTGTTQSSAVTFPPLPGAFQANLIGTVDPFLLKFRTNHFLIWGTYLGGTSNEQANDVKVRKAGNGNPYIVGVTNSTDFPYFGKLGAHNDSLLGAPSTDDGFIAEFNNTTGSAKWITYFGASGNDLIFSLDFDTSNRLFIAGRTNSSTGITPATPSGAYTQSFGGVYDAFIARFTPSDNYDWFTFYGGSSSDLATAVKIDKYNNPVIYGETSSINLPTTNPSGAGDYYDDTLNGGNDAFVVKFSFGGAVQWATYIGGDSIELPGRNSIDFNSYNDLYLGGSTWSNNFPMKNSGGFFDNSFAGDDEYLMRIDGVTYDTLLSTYISGSSFPDNLSLTSIAINADDEVFIAGGTSAINFPVYQQGGFYYQDTLSGLGVAPDGFLMTFDLWDNEILGTYFGGYELANQENIYDMVIDNDFLYAVGQTSSVDTNGIRRFPLFDPGFTAYYDSTYNGNVYDGFVSMFCIGNITGIEETNNNSFNNNDFIVYPNPAIEKLTIKLNGTLKNDAIIELFSIDGKLVYSDKFLKLKESMIIDINNLSQGLYLLRISNVEFNSTIKFSKN